MSRATAREQGSASIWVLVTCALVGLVALGAGMRGEAVYARHRAEAAADLAALAAAGRIGVDSLSCGAAARIAAANGARLSSCRISLDADGRSGTVVVSVSAGFTLPVVGARAATASARAAREPPGNDGGTARDRR